MSSKIIINLGYKTYQIDSFDEEFAAVMNQHFGKLAGVDAHISTRKLLGDYVRLAYEYRAAKRELEILRAEQEHLLEQLKDFS